MRCGPRVDQRFTRHAEGAGDAAAEGRLQRPRLGRRQRCDVVDAGLAGAFHQGRQAVRFLGGPGDDEGAALDERQAEPFVDLAILGVAGADARRLQRPDGGVEPGVQNGAVGLRGAVEHLLGLLQHHHARAVQREAPGDGAADDAGPDHRDVEGLGGVR